MKKPIVGIAPLPVDTWAIHEVRLLQAATLYKYFHAFSIEMASETADMFYAVILRENNMQLEM